MEPFLLGLAHASDLFPIPATAPCPLTGCRERNLPLAGEGLTGLPPSRLLCQGREEVLQAPLLSVRPQKEAVQREETQGSVLLGLHTQLPSLQRALPCLWGIHHSGHLLQLSVMLVAASGCTGMVAAIKHQLLPLLEGWTWPWVCRGAPGPDGHLRSSVCVTWSRSGSCLGIPVSHRCSARPWSSSGKHCKAGFWFWSCDEVPWLPVHAGSMLLEAFICLGQPQSDPMVLHSPRAFVPSQIP